MSRRFRGFISIAKCPMKTAKMSDGADAGNERQETDGVERGCVEDQPQHVGPLRVLRLGFDTAALRFRERERDSTGAP